MAAIGVALVAIAEGLLRAEALEVAVFLCLYAPFAGWASGHWWWGAVTTACAVAGVVLIVRYRSSRHGVLRQWIVIIAVAAHYILTGLGLVFFGGEGLRAHAFLQATFPLGVLNVSAQSLLVVSASAAFILALWAMFERKKFWEAHRVMIEREYYHLENMTNFDQLPPHGFKLSVFPIKWHNTTAAPVRAVAIIE